MDGGERSPSRARGRAAVVWVALNPANDTGEPCVGGRESSARRATRTSGPLDSAGGQDGGRARGRLQDARALPGRVRGVRERRRDTESGGRGGPLAATRNREGGGEGRSRGNAHRLADHRGSPQRGGNPNALGSAELARMFVTADTRFFFVARSEAMSPELMGMLAQQIAIKLGGLGTRGSRRRPKTASSPRSASKPPTPDRASFPVNSSFASHGAACWAPACFWRRAWLRPTGMSSAKTGPRA